MHPEKAKLDAAERNAVLARLYRESKPYYRRLFVALVLGLIAALGPITLSKAAQLLLDGVLNNPKHPLGLLAEVVVGVFLVNLIINAASYGQNYLTAWSGQRLIATYRVRLFERTIRMPLAEFDAWRPGEFFSRFTNDLQLMTDAISISLPLFFNSAVTLIASLATMVYLDWELSLFLFFFGPLVGFVVSRFTRLISGATKGAQERVADLSSNLNEALQGERIIKAFGREAFEVRRFENSNESYFGAYMKSVQFSQTQTPIVAMIITTALLAIMAFSVREVIVGRLTSGAVFQFWTLVILTMNPLNRIATFLGDFSKGLVGTSRVFEILDLPVEPTNETNKIALTSVDGKIVFDDVNFAYKIDATPVLRSIKAIIGAGEIIALVGPSGAGKTTFVNLVPRFYEPQAGIISLDGHDLQTLQLSSLRESIAIVPQEPMLFSGTVADNIRYGKLDATQTEIEAAAREANAEEFVLDLPLGYETKVGERGMRLSGGQRQRISIARAILRDPRILILDEATSALDSHSEKLIESALDQFLPGRTTLIIAHRLSTIRRANRIFYLESGAIVEMGSHDELMALGGRYAALHEAQFAT